ncbi:5'-nucleotidase [Thauera sp. 27]|uniref:bifunctional metallophosphatase/5'-nucleotidase n=1 Tax=Thauera sp. 27 TaxID=305700 RepID=UPI0002CEDCF1|nr:5'-nucleotidase C-terminal domain-containing protein [Thauera sp. 27]ENO74523.1 5'-nucleotidase [Thauera sp. 27]
MNHAVIPAVAVLAGALALAGCISDSDTPKPDFPLAILHINDHHSNLDEASATLRLATDASGTRSNVSVGMGGFPRVVTAIDELATRHGNVLKLHAGDAITGTLYYTLTEGKSDADLMNEVCFDAMAVGNHEFDAGDAGLRSFIDDLWASPTCRTPLLSANLSLRAGSPIGSDGVRPAVVIERGGERIGIIGLTIADKTQNASRPDPGTRLLDEREAAQREIDRLHAQGIDKIVLLTHMGYAQDQALAAQLSGVDVIVGGDSHSLLGDDSLRNYGLSPVGAYPTVAADKDGNTVCIAQAWQYSAVVGELEVVFDGRGKVKSCGGQPHVLIGSTLGTLSGDALTFAQADLARQPALRVTAPNAQAASVLADYTRQVTDFGAEPVANAQTNLCLRRVPGTARDGSRSRLAGCNDDPHVIAHGGDVQQLVAEAFLRQGQRFGGADISLQNGGGVRVDLAMGTVTVGNIYTVLPFKNTLVALDMSGAEIRAALEDAMQSVVAGNTGSYPYAGALRWQVDLRQPRGGRISALEHRNAGGSWVALDDSARYRVITNDFIADGQDGYTTLGTISGERRTDTFLAYADAFLRYALDNPVLARPATADFSTQVFIDTP